MARVKLADSFGDVVVVGTSDLHELSCSVAFLKCRDCLLLGWTVLTRRRTEVYVHVSPITEIMVIGQLSRVHILCYACQELCDVAVPGRSQVVQGLVVIGQNQAPAQQHAE